MTNERYPIARGYKPPPGYDSPRRRFGWGLFAFLCVVTLAAGTAVGWFALHRHNNDMPLQTVAVETVPQAPAVEETPTAIAAIEKPEPSAKPAGPPEPTPTKTDAAPNANAVAFSEVSKLFQNRCVNCHGGQKRKGGLDLRNIDAILSGGDSGPAIVFGSLGESPLWQAVHTGQMPPNKQRKLSEKDLDLIKRWIETGSR